MKARYTTILGLGRALIDEVDRGVVNVIARLEVSKGPAGALHECVTFKVALEADAVLLLGRKRREPKHR